jgi:hypothetical protein
VPLLQSLVHGFILTGRAKITLGDHSYNGPVISNAGLITVGR